MYSLDLQEAQKSRRGERLFMRFSRAREVGDPLESDGLEDFLEDLTLYDERLAFCQKILQPEAFAQVIQWSELNLASPQVIEERAVGELYSVLHLAVELYGRKGALCWWQDLYKQQPALMFAMGESEDLLEILLNRKKWRFQLRYRLQKPRKHL